MKVNLTPIREKGICQLCASSFPKSDKPAPYLCSINGKIVCIECGDKIIRNWERHFLWWRISNATFRRISIIVWAFSWLAMFSSIFLMFVNGLWIILLFLLFPLNLNWPLCPIETPSERIGMSRYISTTAEEEIREF